MATISDSRLAQLRELIEQGREQAFYWWPEWRTVRTEVLRLDHGECRECREKRHRHSHAVIVHHIKHLRDRPDLALSIWDPDTGERQLEAICKTCHEAEHSESLRQYAPTAPPISAERWD